MHDRLGQAGGAGAVEHPQRMIERNSLELERPPYVGVTPLPRGDDLRVGQRGGDLFDLPRAVEVLSSVAVAADCEQDLWLDLLEAVDHGARAELRCGGGPDRS